MPYALLDDQFHSNPKVIAMGLDGAGLYARALSYCGDYLTDGFVPLEWVNAVVGRSRKVPNRLVHINAWARVHVQDVVTYTDRSGQEHELVVHSEGFWIPDYTAFNPSKAEYQATHKRKSVAGRKGAIKRWSDSSSDTSSHSSSDSDSHSTSDGSDDGKPIARARAQRAAPSPTPEEQLAAAANGSLDDHAAAAFIRERLTLAGVTAQIDNDELPRAAAWLDLAEREANVNPAGFVATGIRSGEWPTPREPPSQKKTNTPTRRRRYVEGDGHLLPNDELEYQLTEMGANAYEVAELLDLATELRGANT